MALHRTYLPLLIGLCLCLGLAFVPLGCGSPAAKTPEYTVSRTSDADLPGATVAALTACLEAGADRLKPPSYAIMFDVNVDAGGNIESARVADSTLDDAGVSSCMVSALRGMSLPPWVEAKLRQRVSPQSRRYMGNPAAPALVALGPIALVAAGITVLVVVTVYVVKEVSTSTRDATDEDAERERCKKVKQGCIEYCSDAILDQGFHEPLFSRCVRACMEKANCR